VLLLIPYFKFFSKKYDGRMGYNNKKGLGKNEQSVIQALQIKGKQDKIGLVYPNLWKGPLVSIHFLQPDSRKTYMD
jgi:hypothetical protein